jgi:hypothetical protein
MTNAFIMVSTIVGITLDVNYSLLGYVFLFIFSIITFGAVYANRVDCTYRWRSLLAFAPFLFTVLITNILLLIQVRSTDGDVLQIAKDRIVAGTLISLAGGLITLLIFCGFLSKKKTKENKSAINSTHE